MNTILGLMLGLCLSGECRDEINNCYKETKIWCKQANGLYGRDDAGTCLWNG